MPPFLSADIVDIYYEDHGDSKSYPLVLIHPIGGNILIWHQEIPLLLKNGFRVIAYEIRGHHRTVMGPAKAYAMRELVNDLTAIRTSQYQEMHYNRPLYRWHNRVDVCSSVSRYS